MFPSFTLPICIDSSALSRNFTWAWHTVIMGTGAVSSLINRFHFGAGSLTLKVLTLIFFFLNLFFFVVICGATIARYWMFPKVKTSLHVKAQSMLTRFEGLVDDDTPSSSKPVHWCFPDGGRDAD